MTPGLLLPFLGLFSWLLYFRWKAGGLRLPAWPLLVLGGAAAAPLALCVYGLLDSAGLVLDWEELTLLPLPRVLAPCLVIGLLEELLKATPLFVLGFLLRPRRLSEKGALLLAAHSALGYATAEGLYLYLRGQEPLLAGLARAAAAPLVHAVLSAPLGHALFCLQTRRRAAAARSVLLAAGAHALYDLLLTRAPSLQPLSAALILALWVWLILRLDRLSPTSAAPALSTSPAAGSAIEPVRLVPL